MRKNELNYFMHLFDKFYVQLGMKLDLIGEDNHEKI